MQNSSVASCRKRDTAEDNVKDATTDKQPGDKKVKKRGKFTRESDRTVTIVVDMCPSVEHSSWMRLRGTVGYRSDNIIPDRDAEMPPMCDAFISSTVDSR
jgi:hypothetical protein